MPKQKQAIVGDSSHIQQRKKNIMKRIEHEKTLLTDPRNIDNVIKQIQKRRDNQKTTLIPLKDKNNIRRVGKDPKIKALEQRFKNILRQAINNKNTTSTTSRIYTTNEKGGLRKKHTD